MRVVYYTRTYLLDTALPFLRELSKSVEVHAFLELSPEGWNSSLFDVSPRPLPGGIMEARSVLNDFFPTEIQEYWKDLETFHLVVHTCPRSFRPPTWRLSRKVADFILSLDPDLIHMDDVSIRFLYGFGRLRKKPLILSNHDPDPHSGKHHWSTNLSRWLVFRHASHFILHSDFWREKFCERYGVKNDRVSAIPLGVLDIFKEFGGKSSQAEEPKTVLFFGRIEPYKGLEILYDAAPRVAEAVPEVRFVIAGRPNYDLPPPPKITNGGQIELILEYIPNTTLAQLFQKATVVALPYTHATQSGVALTAYAFEKPVVATHVGGLPEVVRDGVSGLLVPPNDPEALAHALIKILQDVQQREWIKSNIRDQIKTNFSWQRIAEKTIQIYSHVLERKT